MSVGMLFAPKSIYKTPLSSNTELVNLLMASFLLAAHKIHLKSTPFTFSIAMFFSLLAVVNISSYLLQTCSSNLNPTSLKAHSKV